MAFGDRLQYFLGPLEMELQCTIKREHPRSMEVVYDSAIDWAYVTVYHDRANRKPDLAPAHVPGPPSSLTLAPDPRRTSRVSLDALDRTMEEARKVAQAEEERLDVMYDTLNAMDMQEVICWNCDTRGHFARHCKKPKHRDHSRDWDWDRDQDRNRSDRPSDRKVHHDLLNLAYDYEGLDDEDMLCFITDADIEASHEDEELYQKLFGINDGKTIYVTQSDGEEEEAPVSRSALMAHFEGDEPWSCCPH
jgi:hypothetical protein